MGALSRFITECEELEAPSALAAQRAEFTSLGLTDSVLLNVGVQLIVVSTDFRLINRLQDAGCDAHNFYHLRQNEYLPSYGS